MRLAMVCRTAPPVVGGLEHAVGELSVRLAARGHSVVLASFVDGVTPGVERVRLRRVGPRRWPFALGLRAACAGADVVHVHGVDGLLDQVLALRAGPIAVSTHGGYLHTSRHGLLKAVWLRTGTRRSLGRADAVWWSSDSDRVRFAPTGVPGAVETPGVDVDRFLRLPRRPEAGRWVVPGRIDVHKGLEDLLPVLSLLARERPFTVELLGPESAPGLVARLRSRAEALGVADRLVFRGALAGADYDAALARAELAWLPSRAEGFGIAAVELLAAGVPVILSDIAAHRVHAAVAPVVHFTDPWATAVVARRVLARADDPAPGRAAVARYGWEVRVDAFERGYRALAGAR